MPNYGPKISTKPLQPLGVIKQRARSIRTFRVTRGESYIGTFRAINSEAALQAARDANDAQRGAFRRSGTVCNMDGLTATEI
jgi:hypothetical protein